MGAAQSIPEDAPAHIRAIADSKKRTDEEKRTIELYKQTILSASAKTYLNGLAKEIIYCYRKNLEIKYFKKGIECEQSLIDLVNQVFGMFLEKHTERRSDEFITGEPDLLLEDTVIDVKNAWSLDTFPVTPEEAHSDEYEWQIRGYLRLFNKQYGRVIYGLVDTPEDLIRYEQEDLHRVSHFPQNMRLTVCEYIRDMQKESFMIEKVKAAQQYMLEQVERINAAHRF